MKRILALSVLLTACTVGPKYKPPVIETPATFINQEDEQTRSALYAWWNQFNDATLTRLIDDGLPHNFDMRAALNRVYQSRAAFVQSKGELFPQVDAVGIVQRERFSQELFDSPFLGPPVQSFYQLGFDASWELDLFGRLRSGMAAAKAEIGISQEELRDTYITTTAEIARTYFQLRAAQHQVSNSEHKVRLFKELSVLYESQYQAGLVDYSTLQDVYSQLAQVRAALPSFTKAVNHSLYTLAVLVGKRPDELLDILTTVAPLPQRKNPIPQLLPSELLKRRPDIRRAERTLAAASARVGEAVADLFPTVSLIGGFSQQSSTSNTLFDKQAQAWNIGPSVRWPILAFGKIRANIRVKSYEQQEALDLYEKAVYSALENVESSLTGYQTAEETARQRLAATQHLNTQVTLFAAQYDAGYISYGELLEKQIAYLEEESQFFTASEEKLVSLVSLYKALGGEWECSSMP